MRYYTADLNLRMYSGLHAMRWTRLIPKACSGILLLSALLVCSISDVQSQSLDYGDAPDTYSTTGSQSGPTHIIIQGLHLGSYIDADADGQPSVDSDGDDNDTSANDEDGVFFPNNSMGTVCESTSVDVEVFDNIPSINAVLNAWIDFNGNGSFDHPQEHLFGGLGVGVTPGSNTLNYSIPCDAVPGMTYARFRLSAKDNVFGPIGPSDSGEVEDYVFQIKGMDYGDAPDSYATAEASNGPSHVIIPGFNLGTSADNDALTPGQPSGDAQGDDTNNTDDEDGISGLSNLTRCETVNLSVELANSAGLGTAFLDAWVDYNRDGSFDAVNERITSPAGTALSTGANSVGFSVPCNAAFGASFARFRLSSSGGLAPTGAALDGEVEDYALNLNWGYDFDDAPTSYLTLDASGGPKHLILPDFNLGSLIDAEQDAAPTNGATGDDTNGQDDDDGVSFFGSTTLIGCEADSVAVTLSNAAGVSTPQLDAWIDFDRDGTFDHPSEHLGGGTSFALSAGSNTIHFTVPCGVMPTDLIDANDVTYARFRLSSTGNLSPSGSTPNGEVESYALDLQAIDFGDAPDSYSTTYAMNGPRHVVVPGSPSVGNTPDPDDGTNEGFSADMDAEEDGILIPLLGPGVTSCIMVTAPLGGRLDAWIDYNGDGTFQHPGEQIFGGASRSMVVTSAPQELCITPPVDAVPSTYARFRISTLGGLGPTGPAPDGEIEDYRLDVSLPVELTSMVAREDGDRTVLLEWTTGSEKNNAGFSVEHAYDDAPFEEVAFVEGKGNTTEETTYQIRLTDMPPGLNRFRIKQVDYNGDFAYFPEVNAHVELPGRFVLDQAYPNPFNPQTTIRFAVRDPESVRLSLYDIQGRELRTLYEGVPETGRMHSVRINGSDLSSGIYFVRITGKDISGVQKIILLK